MGINHEEQKRQHELAVASDFVAYLRELGHELGDPRPCVIQGKREPDAVCDSPAGSIGIEVADAFHDEEVAKELWSVPRGKRLQTSRGFIDAYLCLAESVNKTLRKHCDKPYSMPKVYFIINAIHAPQTEADDAPSLLPHIQIPENCRFIAVYLRLQDHYPGKGVFIEVRHTLDKGCPG